MNEQDRREARDPEAEARVRSRLEGLVPDAVKKLALAGVGALFMTEEGIRNLVGELKLPREAVTNLLSQTERTRNDLFRMIAEEFRRFLEHSNVAGELTKALTGLTVDVEAHIRFRQAEDGGLVSKVEHTVKRGRKRAEKGEDA